jgi:PKD repeat protein
MTINADFIVDGRVGEGFSTVTFTDVSTGTITSRKWILGDGTVVEGNETIVKHTYRAFGRYDVTLVASNTTEQDTETKAEYIIVNELRSVPNLIIMQSFNPSGDYWRFYLDTDLHLVYESRQYVYRSGDKVVNIKKWTFVEFDVLSEKMYVGSYASNRKEIACSKSINTTPLPVGERITEVAPKSNLKLDELKVWGVEKNLYDYCKSLRGRAGYLDTL